MAAPDQRAQVRRNRSRFWDRETGFVYVSPMARAIIDHPIFQRLRDIKQLPLIQFYFIGATHSRFEHLIGTYKRCGDYVDAIERNTDPDVLASLGGLGERTKELVRIAGLVHDLGHVPFAHLGEELLHRVRPDAPKHEDRSCTLFRRIVAEIPSLRSALSKQDEDFVCDLVVGGADPERRTFLHYIVSNATGGPDADRLDYVVRDASAIGIGSAVSPDRIIQSARATPCGRIAYAISVAYDIMRLGFERANLHHEVYKNPKVIGLCEMVSDAVEDVGFFKRMDEEALAYATETDAWNAIRDHPLIRRLYRRRLYRVVDKRYGPVPPPLVDPEGPAGRYRCVRAVAALTGGPPGLDPFASLLFEDRGAYRTLAPSEITAMHPSTSVEHILVVLDTADRGDSSDASDNESEMSS